MTTKKFFIFTRGRTGSTAIVDELGKHPEIVTMQELFIQLERSPRLAQAYKEHGKEFYKHITFDQLILPYGAWVSQFLRFNFFLFELYVVPTAGLLTRKQLMNHYLEEAEKAALSAGEGERFGFKVLANHFVECPGLKELLKQRGYSVLYLERENTFRQVISGMVAQQRGVYNRKNYTPSEASFVIDLDDFEMLVRIEQERVREEKEMLEKMGFDFEVITYEAFLSDREKFFTEISRFLDVPNVLPEGSEYTVMISSVEESVANYSELAAKVRSMGLGHML